MTIDQGTKVDLSAEHEAEAVEKVRTIVEDALQNSFGRDTAMAANKFQGKLSTDPDKVHPDVDSDSFYSMCGTFSKELHKNLTERKLSTEESRTTREDWSGHEYLVTQMDGVEVLIDPSIAQFLKGHNHVFVGTRRQLRDIVLNKTGDRTPTEGKPYHIWHTRSHNNPQEAFERIWGNTSRPLFPKRP